MGLSSTATLEMGVGGIDGEFTDIGKGEEADITGAVITGSKMGDTEDAGAVPALLAA